MRHSESTESNGVGYVPGTTQRQCLEAPRNALQQKVMAQSLATAGLSDILTMHITYMLHTFMNGIIPKYARKGLQA